ncbi:MAG: addiction module antidote protein [Gammaproteobacteria bacterium]|jgi:probable addiction module antidote protein
MPLKTSTKKTKNITRTADYHEWLINSLRSNPKEAEMYLQAAFEEYQTDNNTEALLLAMRNVAEARGGISKLSKQTKLNRESLYKTLSARGNPKLQTFGVLLNALGFRLSIQAC